MSLQGLDHVTINCADLPRSRAFYADVLGMEDGKRPPFPFPGAWLFLGERPVVHLVGDAASGADTGSLDHVAFEARDFAGTRKRFQDLKIAFEEAVVPSAQVRQLFVRDPDGLKIELNFRGD
jgi:catechol 2,3-dioxygenase-like lactoylglutathione lyase family enzyme